MTKPKTLEQLRAEKERAEIAVGDRLKRRMRMFCAGTGRRAPAAFAA